MVRPPFSLWMLTNSLMAFDPEGDGHFDVLFGTFYAIELLPIDRVGPRIPVEPMDVLVIPMNVEFFRRAQLNTIDQSSHRKNGHEDQYDDPTNLAAPRQRYVHPLDEICHPLLTPLNLFSMLLLHSLLPSAFRGHLLRSRLPPPLALWTQFENDVFVYYQRWWYGDRRDQESHEALDGGVQRQGLQGR